MGDLVALPVRHSPFLDKKGLASHWRCSTRTIERYRSMGMPAEWRDGRWGFHLTACEDWRRAERMAS